jgi:iron complex transport system ATP-binding protein
MTSLHPTKIELSGVSFERGGRIILKNVSWRLAAGEHWAIVGPNGSGKTTLLQIAVGYLWPSEGEVRVLGRRYGEVDLRQLRRHIGWVSSSIQALVRPDQTARQLVLSGAFASTALLDRPTRPQEERAEVLLGELECAPLAESRFGVLSLGEQQKVLIARALMGSPELLILDEACAGLDLWARESVLGAVNRIGRRSERTSLVFVTHHIEEIPPALTHVLALKGGRVHAQGPKDAMLTGEVLSGAFGLHVEVERRFGRYWPRVRQRVEPIE